MKVAIATVQVPFISGGAEVLAASLLDALRARRVEAEIVSIPFKWYPPARLLDMMLMARLVDLSAVNGQKIDRVITLKFPAYYLEHADKVGWLLHQHRQAYDLFDTPFGDLQHDAEGAAVAETIRQWDRRHLPEHRALYTISRNVTDRLLHYSGIESAVLYHPPALAEHYRTEAAENFILAPGRFDKIKRQHLVIEAFAHLPESVKLVLIGSTSGEYGAAAKAAAERLGRHRIVIKGVVTEAEKLDLYARCLAVYNGVYDEDYGYVTLEAFLAGKPVLTHPDSGGPLEFVRHEENGLVVDSAPEAIAEAVRLLAAASGRAAAMGGAGRALICRLGIGWDNVVERLLA
jgi:glycosyltransferase involved in cell wall biosynthesis